MLVPANQVSRFDMGTPKAINDSRAMQEAANSKATILVAQEHGNDPGRKIYLYNICAGWDFPPVYQPPTFPRFEIQKCERGQKIAFKLLPPFVNDPIEHPGAVEGTTEITYRRRPGSEAANSLVNPDSHPRNPFEAQFRDIEKFGNRDQTGNNLNAFGVWWSFTAPDDPLLEEEIKRMRTRLDGTMRGLIDAGNMLNAQNDRKAITPLMHFAMEYFNLEADWHKSHQHRVLCPNCGDSVPEGIIYHRNSFGDRCIIDKERYLESVAEKHPTQQLASEEENEDEQIPAAPAPKNKKARKAS